MTSLFYCYENLDFFITIWLQVLFTKEKSRLTKFFIHATIRVSHQLVNTVKNKH